MICEQCQGTGFVPHKAPWEREMGTIVCMECTGSGSDQGVPDFLMRERLPEVEKAFEKTFYDKVVEPPKSKFRARRKGF
jgi:hypothetical protein